MLRLRKYSDITLIISSSTLPRFMTSFHLIVLGVGIMIGNGTYVLPGIGASQYAGPSLMLSFVIGGLLCAMIAMVYSELATLLPVNGSIYRFAQLSLGEFAAWITGWFLILEFASAIISQVNSWSLSMTHLIQLSGFDIPRELTIPLASGGIVDVPGMAIMIIITLILIFGAKNGIRFMIIFTSANLIIILVMIIWLIPSVNPQNWDPFLPYGWRGMMNGATIAVFSIIGFDIVINASQETKNPRRDMPIGVFGSLSIVALLYIIIISVMTGCASYLALNSDMPWSIVLEHSNFPLSKILPVCGVIISCAVCAFGCLYSLSRQVLAMAEDGLFPLLPNKSSVQNRFSYRTVSAIGIILTLIIGFGNSDTFVELTLGALLCFIIAPILLLISRRQFPDKARYYKCPIPVLATIIIITISGYLLSLLSTLTWMLFGAWFIIGIFIYIFYGYRHSTFNAKSTKG